MKPSNMQANVNAGNVFSVPGLPEIEVSSTMDYQLFELTRAQTMIVQTIEPKDARLYLNILQQINAIPEPEWRLEKIDQLDSLLEGHDFRSVEGHIACIMMSGSITDWKARYRPGTVTHNLVGSE